MKLCPICATSYPATHRTCPTHGTILVETQELPAGTMIRDCYRIERMLGKGGMGTVYLAEHTLMGEPRALKFLSAELASNPTFVQRFLQEARAANKLRHPNVAQTMELGQTEEGSFYISMEFVDGPSLRSVLSQFPQGMDVDRTFRVIHGVAEALGAAHAKRMVHRDIKPENILLGSAPEGEIAKVVDFGIVAMSDSAGRLTQTGSVLLTCEYAAPEQWKGVIPSSELDGRTDLYAMGCMFFEMLTGRLPFRSDSYEGWFELHVHAAPPVPSSIRPELLNWPGLDGLVLQLLAKDREHRPANVQEFLAHLDQEMGYKPSSAAASPKNPEETQRWKTMVDVPRPTGNSGRAPTVALGAQASASGPVSGSGSVPAYGQVAVPPPVSPVGPGTGGGQYPRPGQYQGHPPVQPPPLPSQSGGYSPVPQPQGNYNSGAMGQNFPPQTYSPQQAPVRQQGMSRTGRILLGTIGGLVAVAIAVIATVMIMRKEKVEKEEQSQNQTQTGTQTQTQHKQDTETQAGVQTGGQGTGAVGTGTAGTGTQGTGATVPSAGTVDKSTGNIPPVRTPVTKPPVISSASKEAASASLQGIALYNNKQFAAALPLLETGCNGGHADSCDCLGFMYEGKLGVDRNYSNAAALYKKACDGGEMRGCNNLGNMYLHNLGVEQDYPRAAALFKKGCDGGESNACTNLGVMYETQKGLPQDYARSAALYGKACNAGNANGCSELGNLYKNGRGVPKDTDKARVLLTRGCQMGNKWGCDRLSELQ